jgi:hypothetical protein
MRREGKLAHFFAVIKFICLCSSTAFPCSSSYFQTRSPLSRLQKQTTQGHCRLENLVVHCILCLVKAALLSLEPEGQD